MERGDPFPSYYATYNELILHVVGVCICFGGVKRFDFQYMNDGKYW